MIQNSKKTSTVLEVKDYAEGMFQEAVNRATARLVVQQLRLTADLVEAHERIQYVEEVNQGQAERIQFLEEEITGIRDIVTSMMLREGKK